MNRGKRIRFHGLFIVKVKKASAAFAGQQFAAAYLVPELRT